MNIIDDIKLQYKIGGMANKLIYWNVGVFLLSIIFFYKFKILTFDFPVWISLSSNLSNVLYFPYTLVSYMFLHNGFFHLFSNMLILNFSSRLFLTFFNEKQLVGLYFLGGIFAGLCYLGLSFIGSSYNIVGASGAIMAVLLATTTYQPLMNVRLLLIGNIKLWHLTGVILLLFLLDFQINTGGNIAHFGGAFFGVLYIKLLQNGTDLSNIVTRVINFFANLFKKNPKKPMQSKTQMNYTRNTNRTTNATNINQKQIDEILDKISKSGYDSLTNAEKDVLFRAGKEN